MSAEVSLGDRHLIPDASGALLPVEGDRAGTVRVVAPLEVARTYSGQHMLWMLFNLLIRQDRLVNRVVAEVPEVPLLDGVAPIGTAENLPLTLMRLAEMVVGSHVRVDVLKSDTSPADVEILVANAPSSTAAGHRFCMYGSGWNAYVGQPGSAPNLESASRNPLGPYFSACLAAGEVFKKLRQFRPGRGQFIGNLAFSLTDLNAYPAWADMPGEELPLNIAIGEPYLVGAGAVGQAFALALGATPGVQGHVTVIDPQDLDDITNLNRYPLAQHNDFERRRPKVEIVADYLRSRGLGVHAEKAMWQDYLRRTNRTAQRTDLAAREASYRYETVLSCVDDTDGNSARHAIQNVWPRTLIGASTHGDGLRTTVSLYDVLSGGMCLKCYNPLRDSRQELQRLVSQLQSMLPDERATWIQERNLDIKEIEVALSDPGCASVGMKQLADYVDRPGSPNFSVGFTSVAAGVILAAQFIKLAIKKSAFPPEVGCSHFFYFLNPGNRWIHQAANSSCDCGSTGKEFYKRTWGA